MLSIKQFGQLLGNGTASASTALLQDDTFYDSSDQSLEVYSGMLLETHILCCYQCLHKIGGEFLEIHPHAVIGRVVECAQQNTIGRYDLCCEFVNGVLQVIYGRCIPDPSPTDSRKNEIYRKNTYYEQGPKTQNDTFKSLAHFNSTATMPQGTRAQSAHYSTNLTKKSVNKTLIV